MRLALVLVSLAAAAATAAAARPTSDVYRASLAYALCMRAHGVPHPSPDRNGDFHLTAAQEARLHAVGRPRVEAADKACFHLMERVVSTKPLSAHAKAQAVQALELVRACVRSHGFTLGRALVQDLSRGRALFGFRPSPSTRRPNARLTRIEHACERQVGLAKKLDAIIAVDRAPL